MAEEKIVKTRVQNKHETEAIWNTGTTFVPKPGEVIIYDIDDTHDYQRLKIGDPSGKLLSELPFLNERITESEIDAICKDDI